MQTQVPAENVTPQIMATTRTSTKRSTACLLGGRSFRRMCLGSWWSTSTDRHVSSYEYEYKYEYEYQTRRGPRVCFFFGQVVALDGPPARARVQNVLLQDPGSADLRSAEAAAVADGSSAAAAALAVLLTRQAEAGANLRFAPRNVPAITKTESGDSKCIMSRD
jgi:hypothetical protein